MYGNCVTYAWRTASGDTRRANESILCAGTDRRTDGPTGGRTETALENYEVQGAMPVTGTTVLSTCGCLMFPYSALLPLLLHYLAS